MAEQKVADQKGVIEGLQQKQGQLMISLDTLFSENIQETAVVDTVNAGSTAEIPRITEGEVVFESAVAAMQPRSCLRRATVQIHFHDITVFAAFFPFQGKRLPGGNRVLVKKVVDMLNVLW